MYWLAHLKAHRWYQPQASQDPRNQTALGSVFVQCWISSQLWSIMSCPHSLLGDIASGINSYSS